MRLIQLKYIQGNEILAKPVLDVHGRILLSKGIRLKLSYLDKLNDLGISSVYIEDKVSEGIQIEDTICQETRIKAQQVVQKEMDRFLKTKEIETVEIKKVAQQIIQDVLSRNDILVNLSDIKTKDNYTFAHSVNVCVLSILLSSRLGLDPEKMKSIAVGGLLHDFGKMLLADSILNKPMALTEKEYEEMKKHPLHGYEALRDEEGIQPTTKVMVLMHHERVDGLGYPFGVTGEKIHFSAKICSVCDAFDALTSNRVYRPAWTFSSAVKYLESMAGRRFEKEIIEGFLKHIPLYPQGTMVLLNTGVIGIVVKNNQRNVLRPVVRLLYNTKTHIKYDKYEIDLMEDLTVSIVKEIELDASFFGQ